MMPGTVKPSILVIDDEAGVRDMLVFGLGDRGYAVETASTGDEGIEKIQARPFDFVLCDITMPGKGGIETLQDILRLRPGARVIMTTGFATLETAVESMKLGAYDYLAKPYGLDQLCAVLEEALGFRRTRETSSAFSSPAGDGTTRPQTA